MDVSDRQLRLKAGIGHHFLQDLYKVVDVAFCQVVEVNEIRFDDQYSMIFGKKRRSGWDVDGLKQGAECLSNATSACILM